VLVIPRSPDRKVESSPHGEILRRRVALLMIGLLPLPKAASHSRISMERGTARQRCDGDGATSHRNTQISVSRIAPRIYSLPAWRRQSCADLPIAGSENRSPEIGRRRTPAFMPASARRRRILLHSFLI